VAGVDAVHLEAEVAGVDAAHLDAYVAGYASSCAAAKPCAQLSRGLPLLTGAELAYFQRLDDLAAATLAAR
jgi:hypothetical protein